MKTDKKHGTFSEISAAILIIQEKPLESHLPSAYALDKYPIVSTTPAWTPICALGPPVVTGIGGSFSHRSIVPREYGIPAVTATGEATRRIRTGQLITVDGSAGKVTTF